MTQTQLDLPPISLARYLDLLKRRRWQVIPMTVVGLLVGVVIALLIPRYFVAETTLIYRGLELDPDARTPKDPLYAEVSNAELSIPDVVPETLERLEWIGDEGVDLEREAEIARVSDGIEVESFQQGDFGYFNITIVYRDIDGLKAATLVNEVRKTWVGGVNERFEERARRELDRARQTVQHRRTAVQSALREYSIYLAEHNLDPQGQGNQGTGRGQNQQAITEAWINDELRDEEELRDELSTKVEVLEARIKYLTKLIDEGQIPRFNEVLVPIQEDPRLAAVLQPLLEQLAYKEQVLAARRPGSQEYDLLERQVAAIRAKIELIAPGGSAGGGQIKKQVDNPLWIRKRDRLDESQVELDNARFELDVTLRRIQLFESELESLPQIWQGVSLLELKLNEARQRLDSAIDREEELNRRWEMVATGHPFIVAMHASVPEAPSDPNLFVVILMGGFFGLAAAIGLVLLLDFMRSTFKTVEDVEYAMPVPVLGAMAFFETAEERQRIVRQRRRVSITAATFLVLSLSLVTIYYLDPTRLPQVVRDALDLILGTTQ